MRQLFAILFVLVPTAGYACTTTYLIDPACERDPAFCTRRDLLAAYDHSDVVYELRVQSVRKPLFYGSLRSLNDVKIEHVWKTDNKPLDVLEAGWGGGDCTVALKPGVTYVVFSRRVESKWSILPWLKEPLYAGLGRTFELSEFRGQSSYHNELYMAKTPSSLEVVLEKLRK